MLSSLELYGREVPKVPQLVCNFRLLVLRERLEELTAPHFMEQDTNLINEVLKEQTFWTQMRDGEENGN